MTNKNVYLFIPNLIGYIRIILLLVSFYYMKFDPFIATVCYFLSTALDNVDGVAARRFNQSTEFGATLDMLTDRCATMGLLVVLATFYPSWTLIFQLAITIDIASHWTHCQSAYMRGSRSHKFIDLSSNPILSLYYTNELVLCFMCTGNEMFYTFLYILHFTYGPIFNLGFLSFGLVSFLCVATFPVAVVKMAINVVQLAAACHNVVNIDVAELSKKEHHK